MREMFTPIIEAGRDTRTPGYATPAGVRYGRFRVRCPLTSAVLNILATDGQGMEELTGVKGPEWEHVSVSTPTRCPTWEEMAWVKEQFWTDEETVIEYHVPKAEHVNVHPYVLHLWRPVGIELPRPPSICV